MAIPHTCRECQHTSHAPEINDDDFINPKLKIGQLLELKDYPAVFFRVVKLDHMTMILEKT